MLHALGTLTRPDSIGLPGFTLQVNNRKLIQGFYLGLGISEDGGGVESTMRVIDKLDKMPEAKISELLRDEAGLDSEHVDTFLALSAIRTADECFTDKWRALGRP